MIKSVLFHLDGDDHARALKMKGTMSWRKLFLKGIEALEEMEDQE